MAGNTPPINAAGMFVLRAPFKTEPGAVYVCEEIAGFKALTERGVDIYATYYQPYNLATSDKDRDALNDIDIVTLMSETAPTIHVPSSYIVSYPLTKNIPYNLVYLGFHCGLLPDGLSFTAAIKSVEEQLTAQLGTAVTGELMAMPSTGTIDLARHQQLETARRAKRDLSRDVHKELSNALVREAAYKKRISELEKLLGRK